MFESGSEEGMRLQLRQGYDPRRESYQIPIVITKIYVLDGHPGKQL